ncbi:MAG: N-acetylmuramoyl-L-alanine amidase [Pelagibacterales bacterium]|nr:N-acetylmuramoyl-L-alanine amidase [Pelagibacterales bacterium]
MKLTMKSRNIKKKQLYKTHLSPNFEDRGNSEVKFVIIHYTGMKPLKKTIEWFKDPNSKVSCHWLISENGYLYKIVEEKNIAWHCGRSSWKNFTGLNKYSIGIELDNPGHGINYKGFSKHQMNSLIKLLKNILEKYNISYKNVLAHSDIAPERKVDPGELFNWKYLAKKNLAYFPPIVEKKEKHGNFFKFGDSGTKIKYVKKLLNDIGYKTDANNKFDLKFKMIVEAFQRRFFPHYINGIIDEKMYQRILQIHKNS